jgi:hypothetical protein
MQVTHEVAHRGQARTWRLRTREGAKMLCDGIDAVIRFHENTQ